MTRPGCVIQGRCHPVGNLFGRGLLRRRRSKGTPRRGLSGSLPRPGRLVGIPCVMTRAMEAVSPTEPVEKGVTERELPQTCILVGDIGGTNARLSVWKIDRGAYTKIFEQVILS